MFSTGGERSSRRLVLITELSKCTRLEQLEELEEACRGWVSVMSVRFL